MGSGPLVATTAVTTARLAVENFPAQIVELAGRFGTQQSDRTMREGEKGRVLFTYNMTCTRVNATEVALTQSLL